MMIGTPSELIHRFNQFIDAGVTHFMLWFMDYPSVQSMTIFAEDIRPRLKKI
jgi:alkanesulfonate monooxygenase SsuD/methylene tetrahydromethanopterin reductase-like flavin-dependent oxidoreductase (luciferase family)